MEKTIWNSLLGENYLFGKPVHFSVKNTANNAEGFIQQFFQHLYGTANSIVHLMVWVDIAQIHIYRQQHISPSEVQHCSKILWGIYSLSTIFP